MTLKSSRDKAQWLHQNIKDLKFISGKWFFKDKEIKDIKKYIANLFIKYEVPSKNVQDLNDTLEYFIVLYGNEGIWPKLSIIQEARQLIDDMGGALPPSPYPLDEKQMKIIHALLSDNLPYFFILQGKGGSGKSTFLNIIKQIFDNDFASVAIESLSNESFQLANALKHRLNCCAEIKGGELDIPALKQAVTNDAMEVNEKMKQPYTVTPQTKFIFSCNELTPQIKITDSGIVRRTLYYCMNTIKWDKADTSLMSRTWTHDNILLIVANSLMTDISNLQEDFKDDTRKILLKRNTAFLYQTRVYGTYVELCRGSGQKPYSEPTWKENVAVIKTWGKWLIEEGKENETV